MTLYTKSILKDKEACDGLRISVMSRHTLSDGITPDQRITNECYDEHRAELAPKPRLIGAYYKNQITWNQFEERFNNQIKNSETVKQLRRIATLAQTQNVTLLCIEETSSHCHRRLLAEAIYELNDSIIVIHK